MTRRQIYFARQLILKHLTQAKEQTLEIGSSEMGTISTGLGEIYQLEKNNIMLNNTQDNNTNPTKSLVAGYSRFSRLILIIVGGIGLFLIIGTGYLFWFRAKKVMVAAQIPSNSNTEKEKQEHAEPGSIEVNAETAELVGIKAEAAVEGEIQDTIATIGRVLVEPNQQAIIGAKIEGRATQILAEPGQFVKAGQVLVIIDSPQIAELRGQLIEARAKLKLAEQKLSRTAMSENRAAVVQAKNNLDLAESTLERKRHLASLGAVANREVVEAETVYKNAKAEFDYQSTIQATRSQQEAESELEQAKATVTRLTQSLKALSANSETEGGKIELISPIAGMITDRHISIGEPVTPDKQLLTIMNLSNVIIEAQLPESKVSFIKVGQQLIAHIPTTANQEFEGKILSISNSVDPNKRTVAVRARISNTDFLLKHEMAVDVLILSGQRKNAVLVPFSSLVDEEGIKVVYVKEGEHYERRVVKVGTINYKQAEILNGIEKGEEVVIAGAYQLANMRKGGSTEEGDHDEH